MSKNGYYTAFGDYKTVNSVVEHMDVMEEDHEHHAEGHSDDFQCPTGYVCMPETEFNQMMSSANMLSSEDHGIPPNMFPSEDYIDPEERQYLRNMTEAASEAASNEQSNEQSNEKFDCNRCTLLTDGGYLAEQERNYLTTECSAKCSNK